MSFSSSWRFSSNSRQFTNYDRPKYSSLALSISFYNPTYSQHAKLFIHLIRIVLEVWVHDRSSKSAPSPIFGTSLGASDSQGLAAAWEYEFLAKAQWQQRLYVEVDLRCHMGRAASCFSKSTFITICSSTAGPVGCKQVCSCAGLNRRTWRKRIHWSWRCASLLRLSCAGISCPTSSQVEVEATTQSLASIAPGISLRGRTLMDSKGAGPAYRIVLGEGETE